MTDDLTARVSDPGHADYDPAHPAYLPTADPSSPYFIQEGSPIVPAVAAPERHVRFTDTIERIGLASDAQHRAAAENTGDAADRIGQAPGGWTLDFGDGPPSTWWHAIDHPTMMRTITTNADAAAVNHQAVAWAAGADPLPGLADGLVGSLTSGTAHWDGPARLSAAAQFARISRWVTQVAGLANTVAQQQGERAAVLEETQRQMAAVPPVEFDVRAANDRLNRITDPVAFYHQLHADQVQLDRQAEAQARAADLMTHFDRTLASIGQAPTFPPPPLTANPPAARAVPGEPAPGVPAPGRRLPGTPPAPAATSDHPIGSPGAHPAGSAPPANRDTPSPGVVEPIAAPSGETVVAAAAAPLPGSLGSAPPDLGPGFPASPAIPAPGDGDRFRQGPFAGPFGPGAGGGLGAAQPVPGGRQTGARPSEGVARPGTGVAKPSSTGREQAGPHSGATPQPGAARRKQDEERRGRHFKDLDTPGVFQTDEKTAPPTIGVPENERRSGR
ncbi:hypothetical protein [Amycolatopsis lexingtonensis]|uniref:hypothetical protein n=1 Tax=Amycolatopsis lexingtonensis TaxID=218822 RepID=UPI003F7217C0